MAILCVEGLELEVRYSEFCNEIMFAYATWISVRHRGNPVFNLHVVPRERSYTQWGPCVIISAIAECLALHCAVQVSPLDPFFEVSVTPLGHGSTSYILAAGPDDDGETRRQRQVDHLAELVELVHPRGRYELALRLNGWNFVNRALDNVGVGVHWTVTRAQLERFRFHLQAEWDEAYEVGIGPRGDDDWEEG